MTTMTAARVACLVVVFVLALAPAPSAQSASLVATGDAVRARVPEFGFIEGEVLAQLRDGQSVTVEIEFGIHTRVGGPVVVRARQMFTISFDLWEERFAAVRVGSPSRSISHLTVADVEAWCLDQLVVSRAALAVARRDGPFWVRIESRAQLSPPVPTQSDSLLSLGGLIESFSRRRNESERRRTLDAGPLYLPE